MRSTVIHISRWKVRQADDVFCPCGARHRPWRVFNSWGEIDSEYCSWDAAVHWAGSPMYRAEYFANHPNGM